MWKFFLTPLALWKITQVIYLSYQRWNSILCFKNQIDNLTASSLISTRTVGSSWRSSSFPGSTDSSQKCNQIPFCIHFTNENFTQTELTQTAVCSLSLCALDLQCPAKQMSNNREPIYCRHKCICSHCRAPGKI